MSLQASIQKDFRAGVPLVVTSESPSEYFGAVFEDDAQTGYFYALHLSPDGQAIVDAVHIYNVEQVQDRARSSTVRIAWSQDGKNVALLINDYPHAVFDFEAQVGYCRSGFPPSSIGTTWAKHVHRWSDQALRPFASRET